MRANRDRAYNIARMMPLLSHSAAHPPRNRLTRWYRRSVVGPVAARYGARARRLIWPIPGSEPWRAREIHVARDPGLGDVLMCTPALREVKRLNPRCAVTF